MRGREMTPRFETHWTGSPPLAVSVGAEYELAVATTLITALHAMLLFRTIGRHTTLGGPKPVWEQWYGMLARDGTAPW